MLRSSPRVGDEAITKYTPWLPSGAGHHRHIRKFLVGVLRPVTASQGLYKPNHLPTFFETGAHQRFVDEMGQERIACDEQMRAWSHYAKYLGGESAEKLAQFFAV